MDWSDTVARGLRLRVSPDGSKVFTFVYKLSPGKLRRVTLGPYPELGLADARAQARDARARVRLGADPQGERIEARAVAEATSSVTFAKLAARFLADRRPNLAASTATEYDRQIRAYVEGTELGKLPASEVRRGHIRARLEEVAQTHGPVMANRLFQLIRAVCRWAVREDFLEVNAADGIQRPRKETSRERVLSDEEVSALWRSLGEHKVGEDKVLAARVDVGAVVKTLLLLGQRSTETVLMRGADLDLAARPPAWTIPGVHRKGGRLHIVPLSPAALRTLRTLEPGEGRVFAGVSEVNAERDWWGEVRERARALWSEEHDGAEMPAFCKHDLRRTCATGCAKLGASDFTVSRILGHAVLPGVQVSRVYNRYEGLPEMAAALNAWGAHVERLVSGRRGAVVRIMARA